ncbi:aldolase/citrate lyase family protein [Dyadobacter arcticus]|uniref:HpcH/HpaI aldolase/citrate lyase domain-containing protein n=1 Tax=Dyadobacter arcticus TaxID=1078754 RepID=A0ABX0UHB4_9BACT|nr:aldolase/citrate lyase family protein [Dyadobacter arcticus]NIJ52412.1 hypothetical protein [Dyadobacter arcticus]
MKEMLPTEFNLFLFSNNPVIASQAISAGIDGVIVDWENQGKKLRQDRFDTQINYDSYEDLCRVRDVLPAGKLICRINGFSTEHTLHEVELAIKAGADEIFLPMVHSANDVRQTHRLIANRAGLNILIETTSALECLRELASLPLSKAYIGLNDLHIQQNSRNIFVPLMDNTVRDIRKHFTIPLGAGGVTYPPNGHPIASKYLINEYARLGINFSFLRRSFMKDHQHHSMEFIVQNIRKAYHEALLRSEEEIELDYRQFKQQVESWTTNPHYV